MMTIVWFRTGLADSVLAPTGINRIKNDISGGPDASSNLGYYHAMLAIYAQVLHNC